MVLAVVNVFALNQPKLICRTVIMEISEKVTNLKLTEELKNKINMYL